MRLYDHCSSTSNSSRGRKILSDYGNRFFLPGPRVIYAPNSSDPLFRVYGSSAIYHRPNIDVVCARRFSAMRDLPTDFRLDRCTGCLDSSVRKSAFPGCRSRRSRFAIRFQLQWDERRIETLHYISGNCNVID